MKNIEEGYYWVKTGQEFMPSIAEYGFFDGARCERWRYFGVSFKRHEEPMRIIERVPDIKEVYR